MNKLENLSRPSQKLSRPSQRVEIWNLSSDQRRRISLELVKRIAVKLQGPDTLGPYRLLPRQIE